MKKVLLTTIVVFGILVAGCSRESAIEDGTSAPGSLRITIKSATNPATGRAVGNPSQQTENTIHSFLVFVFHYASGELEKMQEFDSGLTGIMTDLRSSSAKKVVVFANCNIEDFRDVRTYEELSGKVITMESQNPGNFGTTGLFMSGEYSGENEEGITLDPDPEATNSIEIPIRRLAAKVRLGDLIVSPTADYPLENFVLLGVSMQKVPPSAYALGDGVRQLSTGEEYCGGLSGNTISTDYGFLHESISLPQGYVSGGIITSGAYFYVLPNRAPPNETTLLNVYGTYNGTRMYYTFPINAQRDTGVNPEDLYIHRNKVYTLNITLRQLGMGADSPDAENVIVDMDVEIVVVDWESELIHNLEW